MSKDRICESGDERGFSVERPVSETEEGGQQAGDDQDGQQDDQGGGERRRRHADVSVFNEGLLDRWEEVDDGLVVGLLDGESQVAGRDDLNDLLDSDVFKIDLGDFADVITGLTTATALVGWNSRGTIGLYCRCAVGFNSRSIVSFNSRGIVSLNSRGVVSFDSWCSIGLNSWCSVGLNGWGSVGFGGSLRGSVRVLGNLWGVIRGGSRLALVGTLVTADLDCALEVNLHGVGELECLEVSVREDGSGSSEILDLGELGHELGSGDASLLVDELNGSALAVMSHAVADEHVELVVVILDGQNHGHRLANLDKAGNLGSPGSLSDLNLHPASDVVSGKVSANDVQHVNGERSEGDGLLVLVVPRAPQLASLIPDLLNLGIVLDDNCVLKEGSRSRVSSISVKSVLGVSSGSARVDGDVEFGAGAAESGGQVNAVDIGVVALGEDDSVEWLVEFDKYFHQVLFTGHVEADNLGHVRLGLGPGFVLAAGLV